MNTETNSEFILIEDDKDNTNFAEEIYAENQTILPLIIKTSIILSVAFTCLAYMSVESDTTGILISLVAISSLVMYLSPQVQNYFSNIIDIVELNKVAIPAYGEIDVDDNLPDYKLAKVGENYGIITRSSRKLKNYKVWNPTPEEIASIKRIFKEK